MSPGLIIFDCDGVLVDSEVLVVGVEAHLLTEAGFPISSEEIIDRFVGLSYRLMMEQLAIDFGKPVPAELQAKVEAAALERLAQELLPLPGMADLLASLDAVGQPRCVASSSDLARIELSLDVAGLASLFAPEHVFSTQMVDRPKPAPDVFLLAASTMGVAVEDCVVIEDSPHGIAGANAAGMSAVGLIAGGHAGPGLGQRLLDAGAERIFSSVSELAGFLA